MAVNPRVVLQNATHAKNLPSKADFKRWISAALAGRHASAEVTVRIVDEDEGRMLNRRYRQKDSPTNVLSFPAQLPADIASPLLGDLVLCAPVVIRQAAEQVKSPEAHWAHLTIHGTLHLLGYDHETSAQAEQMESLETLILAGLGYPDPYR
ncbi:MAG: rRNA maturation RNase YbeY [Gammaproteobacteria bacterium]